MPSNKTGPDYATELRDIRVALGLNQEQFGEKIGTNNDTVSRYERGANLVPEPVIRLARLIYRQYEGTAPYAAPPVVARPSGKKSAGRRGGRQAAGAGRASLERPRAY